MRVGKNALVNNIAINLDRQKHCIINCIFCLWSKAWGFQPLEKRVRIDTQIRATQIALGPGKLAVTTEGLEVLKQAGKGCHE